MEMTQDWGMSHLLVWGGQPAFSPLRIAWGAVRYWHLCVTEEGLEIYFSFTLFIECHCSSNNLDRMLELSPHGASLGAWNAALECIKKCCGTASQITLTSVWDLARPLWKNFVEEISILQVWLSCLVLIDVSISLIMSRHWHLQTLTPTTWMEYTWYGVIHMKLTMWKFQINLAGRDGVGEGRNFVLEYNKT